MEKLILNEVEKPDLNRFFSPSFFYIIVFPLTLLIFLSSLPFLSVTVHVPFTFLHLSFSFPSIFSCRPTLILERVGVYVTL